MCGYSNAAIFKTIDDEDINFAENFVKNEIIQYFESDDDEADLSEEDKQHFFGVYTLNPKNFAFLRGERKLIKALSDHIKSIEAGPEGLTHFQLNENGIDKIKISWKGTFESKIGMHFGFEKANVRPLKVIAKTPEELKIDLFEKFQKFIHRYFVDMASDLSPNLVEIKIVRDNNIEAKVQCVICHQLGQEKKCQIFCQKSRNSQCWVFSNLKKHMLSHDEPRNNNREVQNTVHHNESFSVVERGKYLEKEAIDTSSPCEEETRIQYDDIMFTQLSVQNLKMKNAICLHKDAKEDFSFNLSKDVAGTIKVAKMKPDGNCLFSALTHQLFYLKVDSKEHQTATMDIRQKSAVYIKENFSLFAHAIKGRVLEHNNNALDVDVNTASSLLVNQLLPKSGYWGGFESMKAISLLYKINILIFSEDGDFYFANGFNADHERSVFLAFRDANKLETKAKNSNNAKKKKNSSPKNHYDSVVDIDTNLISECSKCCAEILEKSKVNSNSIISLDDSCSSQA